ncbi:MAG: ABC transporter ATP-binding protein [Alphaproteobacteria bacterium]
MVLLEVENLAKSYSGPEGPLDVLRDVSLSLAAGETLALTGESGSGKSTLLHLIAGLDAADSGTIKLAGQNVTALDDAGRAALRRNSVGIVFQQFNLIPSLTVAANIAFQARLSGKADAARMGDLAASLGLTTELEKYPEQLSGGQQQRVAIARALAARPQLILADEPTGNLDETTSNLVLDQMLALVADAGTALVMVTHSPTLAAQLEHRLNLSQGRLA